MPAVKVFKQGRHQLYCVEGGGVGHTERFSQYDDRECVILVPALPRKRVSVRANVGLAKARTKLAPSRHPLHLLALHDLFLVRAWGLRWVLHRSSHCDEHFNRDPHARDNDDEVDAEQ